MTQHHFNIEIATKYGVDLAIFLDNVAYWTRINIANRNNFHDGRYWTRNTQQAFSELFPYWSVDQLRRIIKNSVSNDLLVEGNYNRTGYDQTKWYALTDLSLDLFSIKTPLEPAPELMWGNPQMDLVKPPNRIGETTRPIPNSNLNKKQTTTTAMVKDEQISFSNEIPVVVVISKEIDKILLQEKVKRPTLYAKIDDIEFLKQCKFHLAGNDQDKHNQEGQLNGLIKIISKKEGGFKPPAAYLKSIRLDKQRLENAIRQKKQDDASRAQVLVENNITHDKPSSDIAAITLRGLMASFGKKPYSDEGEIQPC